MLFLQTPTVENQLSLIGAAPSVVGDKVIIWAAPPDEDKRRIPQHPAVKQQILSDGTIVDKLG
jgi:hypothetical protein